MSVSDGSIALSFTALQSAESQLSGNLSALRSRLAQLEAELSPLVQSWSGDAQVAYLVQKRQWEQAADDLAMMLGAIVTGLSNTSTDFSGTQRRIVAAFSG
jgi:WXG100 family type VII secretion target